MSLPDYFVIYTVLRRLTRPFDQWNAYRTGVIDEHGTVLIPKDQRNPEQRQSLSALDVMILNIKKMLARLPGGSTKLASLAAALLLMKEGIEDSPPDEWDQDMFFRNMDDMMESLMPNGENNELYNMVVWKYLDEDAPTNNVGSGAIANPQKPWRGNFAGQMVFRVGHKVFHECRMGKYRYHRWDKYVGEDEIGRDIREYGLSNTKTNIIVQDELTDAMIYLRKVTQ